MNKLYCHLCGKEITGINTIRSDIQDGEFWEACDDENCESGGTWFPLSHLEDNGLLIDDNFIQRISYDDN